MGANGESFSEVMIKAIRNLPEGEMEALAEKWGYLDEETGLDQFLELLISKFDEIFKVV